MTSPVLRGPGAAFPQHFPTTGPPDKLPHESRPGISRAQRRVSPAFPICHGVLSPPPEVCPGDSIYVRMEKEMPKPRHRAATWASLQCYGRCWSFFRSNFRSDSRSDLRSESRSESRSDSRSQRLVAGFVVWIPTETWAEAELWLPEASRAI